jgi:hypothetical protein
VRGLRRASWPPPEFTVTGTLKTWDIMDRLPEIGVPTLLAWPARIPVAIKAPLRV